MAKRKKSKAGRRRRGEPPAYLLHAASGLAYVTLQGKPKYLGPHGTPESLRKYREIIRQFQRAADVQASPSPHFGATVTEMVNAFMIHARTHYVRKDGTHTDEVAAFALSLRPLVRRHGDISPDEIGQRELKTLRQEWIDAGLARLTINKQVGRVRRLFRWGVENEWVEPATLAKLREVRDLQEDRGVGRETEPVLPAPLRSIARTLGFLNAHQQAMVRLQYYVGMRPGEVCRMRGREIHRSGTVKVGKRTVRVAGGVWIFWPERSKVKVPTLYAIGPRAQAILKPFLRKSLDEFIFQPREAMEERTKWLRANRKSKVPPSQQNRRKKHPARSPGDYYLGPSYAKAVEKAAERAGVPHWHPNQLRHNYLTWMDRAAGIEIASVSVSHKRISTTEIYIERNLMRVGQVAERLG